MEFLKLMLIILTGSLIISAEESEVCKDGYYGYNCAYKCGGACLNNKCKLSKSGTFSCTDGCIDGHRGDSCRSKCPPYCMKCQRYSTARCFQCTDYHFGLSCERSCGDVCPATGCDTDGKCLPDNKNGICGSRCKDCNRRLRVCGGCEAGFYGENCELPCNENCGCVSDDNGKQQTCTGQCEKKTGNCTRGCVKPYFGNKCQHRCSEHCVDDACNANTGACLRGCNAGYFGEKCESGCNDHCKDWMCDVGTGECEHGCADGYYGVECTMGCSKHCAHSICQRETGDCTNGCSDGHFGVKCQQKCGAGCGVCNRDSGECIVRLSTGETGNTTYAGVQAIKPDTPYLYFIVGGVAGFVLLLTISSIILSCRFCRKEVQGSNVIPEKDQTSKQIPEPERSFMDFNGYSETYEEDIERRPNLSTRRTRSFSHHQPATEGLVPSAPPCYGFKRASTLGCGDRWRRSENMCRSCSVETSRDTDNVVSELKRLTSLEDYIKVCDASECHYVSVK